MIEADLILLDIRELDVILGMDCLVHFQARMECFMKRVWFSLPDGSEFCFEGDRRVVPTCMISWLSAKNMISKGCTMLLAHIRDTTAKLLELSQVPVARDFPDVFSDNVVGLPLE